MFGIIWVEKISYSNGKALSYTYDSNGNILTIKNEYNSLLASYEYDSLGQLVRENLPTEGLTKVYTYYNGNIFYIDLYNYTTGTLGNRIHRYTYDYWASDWGDLLTHYGDIMLSYDEIGNPLTWNNNMQFTWAEGRRLATLTNGSKTASYTYNQDGIRTSKTVNGVRTDYYLNGTTIVMQKTGDNCIWFTYDENGLVTGFKYNDQNYYYYKNLQGDILGIIDESGTVVAEYTYNTWGDLMLISDASGPVSDPNHIAFINPFRYRGYYYDNESGLYYLNSRYYDPIVCRFLNADGYVSTGQGVLGNNMFAYCGNDPINKIDTKGDFWYIAIAVVAVISCAFLFTGDSSTSTESATEAEQRKKAAAREKYTEDNVNIFMTGEDSLEDDKINIEILPTHQKNGKSDPDIHIYDSYLVDDKYEQEAILDIVIANENYNNDIFTRSKGSYLAEWRVHNLLYNTLGKLGICTENFEHTDLNERDFWIFYIVGWFYE